MCRYRLRRFYSKGAFLVLVWNFLLSFVDLQFVQKVAVDASASELKALWWLPGIPVLLIFPVVLTAGWLADAKFGKYKVLRTGCIMIFIATVCGCLFYVLCETMLGKIKYFYLVLILVWCMFAIGIPAYFVNSLHLGLDQMPDASSSSIASFIAWFVFSFCAGFWVDGLLQKIQENCIIKDSVLSYHEVWVFIPVLTASIALISDILLAKKWLIIEPKSPQTLTTMYKVLKFAAKHKAPLNRSAFTFWEENLPSRLDLGKSKYGGPFTTEQVEDVKTIFRLLLLSMPLWVVILSIVAQPVGPGAGMPDRVIFDWTLCSTSLFYAIVFNNNLWIIVGIVVFELVLFPLFQNRFPSILKRIGIACLSATIVTLLPLTVEVLGLVHEVGAAVLWTSGILHSIASGLCLQLLITSTLELVCAQSPYNIRGLFGGFVFFLFALSFWIGGAVTTGIENRACLSVNKCPLVIFSVKMAVGLVGFILFCVLARWYKRRVRDNVYDSHRVVEEVYDRYLTAVHSRVNK